METLTNVRGGKARNRVGQKKTKVRKRSGHLGRATGGIDGILLRGGAPQPKKKKGFRYQDKCGRTSEMEEKKPVWKISEKKHGREKKEQTGIALEKNICATPSKRFIWNANQSGAKRITRKGGEKGGGGMGKKKPESGYDEEHELGGAGEKRKRSGTLVTGIGSKQPVLTGK